MQGRWQNIYPDTNINTPVLLRYGTCACPLLTGHATSFFTCIQKAAGSNLCQITKYPYSGFLWFSSVPPDKSQDSILN